MKIKFELKKCPFCGGEAQIIVAQADIKLYGIECKKCHILMGHTVNNSTEFFRKPIYAADAWNQRAETAAGQCEVIIDAKAWDELPVEAKAKMMKALRGTTLRVAACDMGHLPATKCNIPMPEVKPCKEQEDEKTLIEVVKFFSHNENLTAMILQDYISKHGPLSNEAGNQIKKILENADE